MKDPLTHSMNGLHTWSGLLFGWLLFAIFLTGTLTIFDTEITSWMQPESQVVISSAGDLDRPLWLVVKPDSQAAPWRDEWSTARPPILTIKLHDQRTFSGQTIDPSTGNLIIFRDTQGGEFFYHFHSGLLLGLPGAWIVGIAGTAMFVALSTGLVIHRRIVKDVFTLRSLSVSQRAWLDVHNVTGLLAFPFSLMITITGMTLFCSISMPAEL